MDYVTRQFINLVKHFRKDLGKLLSELNTALQKQTEAIRKAYQSSDNNKSPNPAVTVLNNFPSSIEVHQNEHDTKAERNYKRFMFLVSTLTLGAIVIYAVLVFRQYEEMIKATVATELTFREIQKQTEIARQQLVGTQAAILDYSTPTWRGPAEGDAGKVSETLINHGLVSAKDVILDITVIRERLSDFQPLEPPVKFHKGPEGVKAAGNFVLDWHMPWKMKVISSPKGPSFPLSEWPKDWPGNEAIEIKGDFSYNNGFDDRVSKTFCFRWIPMFSYATLNGSQGIGGMPSCDDTVTTIQWSLAKRKEIDAQRKGH